MSRTAPSPAQPATSRSARLGPRRTIGLGVLACSLLLGACGSSDALGGKVVKDGLGCEVSEVDRKTDDVPVPEAGTKVGKETTTETIDKAPKKACAPAADQYLTVDMVGATADDGKVFTNTFEDGQPLTVRLGQGQLIAGLETGMTGMKVGERLEIVVPADQAYGKDGSPAQGIGPNEDLVFYVDLISVADTPTYCNPVTTVPEGKREGKPTEVDMPAKAPTEVKTTVLTEGDGPKATKKSYLTVDYAGFSCASGQQFDSSWDGDAPITIAMSDATPTETAFSVIPGWTTGLDGQKQGSTVQIDIPFEDGYGTAGSPPAIGPSDPLTFIVKIIEVSDEAPPAPSTTTTAAADPAATTTTAAGQ